MAGVAVATAVVASSLLSGANEYRLHARFADAGQLIEGAAVRIAGRKAGTVERLELTADGQVDATLSVGASDAPLHVGTHARIRATGQAGLANRYVELTPGPMATPALRNGATLSTAWTDGIVDLDALFDVMDPRMRSAVRRLVAGATQVFAGSGSSTFNAMLRRMDPAMTAVASVSTDLSADEHALRTLVRDSSIAAAALAHRRVALERSVERSAGALQAIAQRRDDLAATLRETGPALIAARTTLRNVASTTQRLRPTLRDLPPAAAPLRDALRTATPAMRAARPVFTELRRQLPDLRAGFALVRRVAGPIIAALQATGRAAGDSAHIVRGLRIYGADFVLGVTNGLAGIITSNYNRVGHYGRLNFVENPQTVAAGAPAGLLSQVPLVPGVLSTRTGITALCPGGNQPPAPDGSNRVVVDRALCDPAQSIPASVNEP